MAKTSPILVDPTDEDWLNPDFREGWEEAAVELATHQQRTEIATLRKQLETARSDALEEAAKIAETPKPGAVYGMLAPDIATAIRARKR